VPRTGTKEELIQIADDVVDEASFLRFLRALADDWNDEQAKEILHPSSPYGSGANGWENGTIGNFLDAMIAWANAKPAEDTSLAAHGAEEFGGEQRIFCSLENSMSRCAGLG
jgi:hypothetical protein